MRARHADAFGSNYEGLTVHGEKTPCLREPVERVLSMLRGKRARHGDRLLDAYDNLEFTEAVEALAERWGRGPRESTARPNAEM